MAMELFVILALQDVPSTDELNAAAAKLSVPVVWESNVEILRHTGFLPAKLVGIDSGSEVSVTDYSEIKSFLPEHDTSNIVDPVVVSFRWGGDFQEASVTMYAAYVLAETYTTLSFEPQSGIFLSADQLQEGAMAMQGMN